ncbi:MAG TPA: DUF4407 domain-containing protein [Ignavibacteria bacterium]|nr:DUF4407 domain-containing protein [Ignavibacteria bacterium]HMR40318.1 DUF4407 domain-containing protein [Ignavibacteria bacterium]
MLKLYCLITGEDYNLVKNETPESRKKISMFAMLIFLPVILWCIQGYLIVTLIMKGTFLSAILTSVTAGLMVFIIERSIIMSNGGKPVFITRLILGLLIAVIGAITIDEVFFRNDIDRQLEENKRYYAAEEINKWEDANVSKVNLQDQITTEADSHRWEALQIYLDEINGTGGTGNKGFAMVAKEKNKIYENLNSVYEYEKSKLDITRDEFEAGKTEFRDKLENMSDDGLLLHRIQAMFDLLLKNKVMLIFCSVFTLVFLIIELLVVILKISSKKSHHEIMNEMKESIGASRIKRFVEKDPQHFKTSDHHPEVRKLDGYIKNGAPKLF